MPRTEKVSPTGVGMIRTEKWRALQCRSSWRGLPEGQGGEAELLRSVEPMVRGMAHRWTAPGCRWEDLCQAGMQGAMEALRKWDPELGVKFVTLAFFCIRKRIQEERARHYHTSASWPKRAQLPPEAPGPPADRIPSGVPTPAEHAAESEMSSECMLALQSLGGRFSRLEVEVVVMYFVDRRPLRHCRRVTPRAESIIRRATRWLRKLGMGWTSPRWRPSKGPDAAAAACRSGKSGCCSKGRASPSPSRRPSGGTRRGRGSSESVPNQGARRFSWEKSASTVTAAPRTARKG